MLPDPSNGLVVRRNIKGAPLQLDTRVLITTRVDDDTADQRFSERVGVVTGYVYDCPAEQYPHRPLVLVSVEGLGEELFFPEELRVLANRRRAGVPVSVTSA
ncbi:MAG: Carotenogenesis protein CarS [Archangium sp.]|nr:Carotenogenesis protein CarS [Archangium sp.]